MTGLSIPSYVSWANVKRFGKMLPYYICDGSVVHEDALKRIVKGTKDASGKYVGGAGYKNFGRSLRQSFLETETAYKSVIAQEGSFWNYAKRTFKELPGKVGSAYGEGSAIAKAAGKSGIWGGLKGAGGALLKRMPLIGSVIYAATEIPNIYRATKDGGILSGATEACKAVGKMAGFTAGAAIGQALCPIPFVGAIIGGMLGEKLVSLVAGKSYTEQKEKIEQEAVEKVTAQNIPQEGSRLDTGSTNPFAQGLSEDELAKLEEIEAMIGRRLTDEQKAQLAQLDEEISRDPNFDMRV